MADNPIFNRLLQEYDQDIVNNKDWVTVKECESLINAGDRTVRNKAQQNGWKKKYAKVEGSPMVYFLRADVESYMEKEGLLHKKAFEEAQIHKSADETASTAHGNDTQDPSAPLQEVQQALADPKVNIDKFLTAYKDSVSKVGQLEVAVAEVKGKNLGLKINMGWLAFLALAGCGMACFYFYRSESLFKSNADLSTKYVQAQEEAYKSKTTLLEKEQIILNLSTVNSAH